MAEIYFLQLHKSKVNIRIVSFKKPISHLVPLLLCLEDVSLLLGLLLVRPGAAEVVVVQLLRDLDAGDVDGGLGAQEEALVHAAQRAPVYLEGAWNANIQKK